MSLSLKLISPEMKLSLKALKDKKYFNSQFVKKFLNLPVCTTFIKKTCFSKIFYRKFSLLFDKTGTSLIKTGVFWHFRVQDSTSKVFRMTNFASFGALKMIFFHQNTVENDSASSKVE